MDASRAIAFVRSTLDPRAYVGLFRVVHWYNRVHISQRRLLICGEDVRLSPLASFANAERISLGDRTRVGDHVYLWAGDREGRIVIGKDCLFAPGVFVTASDYSLDPDSTIKSQVTRERDVIIGDDVWIGTGCVITAGVEIGHGAVIGAGSVVRQSVPDWAIVKGNPAQVSASRLTRKVPADAGEIPSSGREDLNRRPPGPQPTSHDDTEPRAHG
jgi:acetyltransferase-like isoleucine patch superfamily enzyme